MNLKPDRPQALRRRIEAAQGRIPCDLLLKRARYLNVFTCEWQTGDIAVVDGTIVATDADSGLRAAREVDLKGKGALAPGFIDAHVHVESSMMIPRTFERSILPRGTTSAVCDPHEIANVVGVDGIRYFLESADRLQMDLWVMLSSCVPATHLETNGGGILTAEDLLTLAPHSRALGLAEMMNMPGVLNADPEILKKLDVFTGRPLDGHSPLLRGKALSAYLSAGITSCHESSELPEAREKLEKGMSVWIREGSVAKDLEALAPLLTLATSTTVGFCTDDRNPYDIATEGHIDHLIRGAIRKGVAPEVALRSASWSVARHYGLDRGWSRVGAIAPGYQADLVVLDDVATCTVGSVYKRGTPVDELAPAADVAAPIRNTVRASAPAPRDLEGPAGQVRVIEVWEGKILTGARTVRHDAPGVQRLSVLERYGHGSKPANAYVYGFGEKFRGAIASTVGHDSHNLIAVGDRAEDMSAAMAALIESGGGFCVVRDGAVLAHVALPFGGLMSESEPAELRQGIERLREASRSIGCTLHEPFLQLAFLSLPVIPSLKLTDKGLVDVDQFKIVDVRV